MFRSGKITKEQIPDKIKKLMMDENYSQEQAVAIALEMWRHIQTWIDEGMTEDEAIRHAVAIWEAQQALPIWEADNRQWRSNRAVEMVDDVEGIIRGYVAIWGDSEHRDSYDTWFDRQRPPEMDLDLLPIALRYEHGMDGGITYERIGEVYKVWFDDIGIPFEARLDKSSPYFERVIMEIRHGTPDGKLRTSSGTLSYIADFYDDGAFKAWPVGEMSLTAMAAEPRIPEVELVRSNQNVDTAAGWQEAIAELIAVSEESTMQLKKETLQKSDEQSEPMEVPIMKEKIQAVLDGLGEGATLMDFMSALMASGISMDEMDEAVKQLQSPEMEAAALSLPANASDNERFAVALQGVMEKKEVALQSQAVVENRALKAEIALMKTRQSAPPVVPARSRGDSTNGGRVPFEVRDPYSGNRAYAHLPLTGMMFAYQYLRSLQSARGREICENLITEGFVRNMMEKQLDRFAAHENGSRSYRSERDYYTMRSAFPVRANELMQTDVSGQGLEWIYTGYGTELWEKIRVGKVYDTLVQKGLWEQEITGSTFKVMLVGNDPTWYKHSEPSSVDTTTLRVNLDTLPHYVGTENVTVTPGTAMTQVIITDELKEDSLIDVVAQYQKQVEIGGEELVESLIINADNDGTINTNINLIDGTPNATTTKPAYLVTNGALKLALVTNTANKRDGSTLASSDFLETRKLLGATLAADPDNVVYISDVTTMLKALELTDVKTKDVFTGATIENGAISGVYGSAYLTSGQMALANSAGKIPTAGGTLGRILAMVPRYWTVGWKRHVQVEAGRDIQGLADIIVVSFRMGVQYRTDEAAAVTYNLTV